MWLKDLVKELIAAMFAAAFITFTGMGLIPIEAFVGVAAGIVTYFYQEKSKDKLRQEIRTLRGEK